MNSTAFSPLLGDKDAVVGLIERHVLARYGEVLADTATKINASHQKAQHHAGQAIEAAKEVGAMLLEVKKQLPHGEFLPWVSANCTVSERQARRYMAAALGKPTPVRAIKTDTVSDLPKKHPVLEVRDLGLVDGELVHISRTIGTSWQDDIFIFPHAKDLFYAGHITGAIGSSARLTYFREPLHSKGTSLWLNITMPHWWDKGTIERGVIGKFYATNPLADDGVLAGGAAA